jgi:hypothetical protein
MITLGSFVGQANNGIDYSTVFKRSYFSAVIDIPFKLTILLKTAIIIRNAKTA